MGKVGRRIVVAMTTSLFVLTPGCAGSSAGEEPTLFEPVDNREVLTGTLTVRFSYRERTSLYAEGARHYMEVSRRGGATVLRRDEGIEQGPGAGYVDSVQLPPGPYRVETFQRSCPPAEKHPCESTIDPAQDRCVARVSVVANHTTRLRIRLRLPDPCTVNVS